MMQVATVAAMLAALQYSAALTTIQEPVVGSSGPPEFPNNLVMFPNRDFITIEGFQDFIDEESTLVVFEGADRELRGQADGTIVEGDVAYEVNHPGGYCWGNNAPKKLQVTPELKYPQSVALIINDDNVAECQVMEIDVDDAAAPEVVTGTGTEAGTWTVRVGGPIGPAVKQTQVESRFINPELRTTAIGRRDIRAFPSDTFVPDPKTGSYLSRLTFPSAGRWLAEYQFTDQALARQVSRQGGARVMAWQIEDADANRQCLTIAEADELGGPGLGGCPLGPAGAGAPNVGEYSVLSQEVPVEPPAIADKVTLTIKFEPVIAFAGGNVVSAIDCDAVAVAGGRKYGQRVTKDAANDPTQCVISGIPKQEYTVDVRSIAGLNASPLYKEAPAGGGPSGDLSPEGTGGNALKVTVTGKNGSLDFGLISEGDAGVAATVLEGPITFVTDPAGAQCYFTQGPEDTVKPAVEFGSASDASAIVTTAGITITPGTELTTVKFACFSGLSVIRSGSFPAKGPPEVKETPATPPTAVVASTSTTTPGALNVVITPAASGPVVSKWKLTATPSDGTAAVVVDTPTATLTQTITGLSTTGLVKYTVTVQGLAKDTTKYGDPSPPSDAVTPSAALDSVTVAAALYKAGDFRMSGSTVMGAQVQIFKWTPSFNLNSPGTPLGTGLLTALNPAVTQAGSPATWELRLRTNVANPGNVIAKSTRSGVVSWSKQVATTAK